MKTKKLAVLLLATAAHVATLVGPSEASIIFRGRAGLVGDQHGGIITPDPDPEPEAKLEFASSVPGSVGGHTGSPISLRLDFANASGGIVLHAVSASAGLQVTFESGTRTALFSASQPGTYSAVIGATDASGATTQKTISIAVAEAPAPDIADIPQYTLALGFVGETASFRPTVTDSADGSPWSAAGTTFSISTDLSGYGLSFDTSNGSISGQITNPAIVRGVTITVTSPYGGSDTSTPFDIYLSPSTELAFSESVASSIQIPLNAERTYPLFVENKVLDITYASGALPSGLTVSFDQEAPNYRITASTPGQFSFDITASDAFGREAIKSISVEALFKLGVAQISTSDSSTCAVTLEGALYCWGANQFGQIGDGTNEDKSEPTLVQGMTAGVTKVDVGSNYTCAIRSGAAYCWGQNDNGQLGNSTNLAANTPQPVSNMTAGVTDISVTAAPYYSRRHTCAIKDGSAHCWGFGTYGQLGNGGTSNSNQPVQVSGLTSGVTAIRVGEGPTCALVSGGLKCWGNNFNGSLPGGSGGTIATPIDINGLTSGVTSFDVGTLQGCAVLSGTVKCWGHNDAGQIGDNTASNKSTPITPTGLPSDITSVSTDGKNTCAVSASGQLYCWGSNTNGALGNGSGTESRLPTAVPGMDSGVSSVSVGLYRACAMKSGKASCWGNGTGPTPVEVAHQ